MKIKFLPQKFTLKDDWKDGGDYEKSIGLIHKSLFAIILLVVLFSKVFKDGVQGNELLGFVMMAGGAAWAAGLIKFEIVEGEKTMFNTIIWGALMLAGAFILFA